MSAMLKPIMITLSMTPPVILLSQVFRPIRFLLILAALAGAHPSNSYADTEDLSAPPVAEEPDLVQLYKSARESEGMCIAGPTDAEACNRAEALYLRILSKAARSVHRQAALTALHRMAMWQKNRSKIAQVWHDSLVIPPAPQAPTPPPSKPFITRSGDNWSQRNLPWLGWTFIAAGTLVGSGVGGLHYGLSANTNRQMVVTALNGQTANDIRMSHSRALWLRDEADQQERQAWLWGGVGGGILAVGVGILVVHQLISEPDQFTGTAVEATISPGAVTAGVPGWGEVSLWLIPSDIVF